MDAEQRRSLAMSRCTFWGLAACLLGAYVLVRRILTWWRLRHVPGPTAAAWTSLWLINKTWQGKVFESLGQVCERYGECISYGSSRFALRASPHCEPGLLMTCHRPYHTHSSQPRLVW